MATIERDKARAIGRKARAYAVHVLTASGVVFAFLAVAELFAEAPDPRWVFLWLAVAGFIDAVDGPLARRWRVKAYAARIGGRTIDDIVDYLTFTFVPLLLVWRMGWVPPPEAVWVVPAMAASLFGFANANAKQADAGFFLGFPSYWNVVAYYVGILVAYAGSAGAVAAAVAVVVFTVLTLVPVRFVYPNQAVRPWRGPVLVGGVAWVGLLLALLPAYPAVPLGLVLVSLVYPVFYLGLSAYLDATGRSRRRGT